MEVEDEKIGRVRLTRWSGFHFQKSPKREMEIIRVEVIEPKGRKRKFKPQWGIDGFNHGPLAQQNLVYQLDQAIFHVLFSAGDQFQSTLISLLK